MDEKLEDCDNLKKVSQSGHHASSEDCSPFSKYTVASNSSQSKRYWNSENGNQENKNKCFLNKTWNKKNFKPRNSKEILGAELNNHDEKNATSFLRPFEPYESLMTQPQEDEVKSPTKIKIICNRKKEKISCYHNNTKNSLNSLIKHHNTSLNHKILENSNKTDAINKLSKRDINQNRNRNHMTAFDQAKQNKFDNIKKMKEKKAKSKSIRDKNKLNKSTQDIIDIISIEESDNDEEDVICIPTPEPPLIDLDEFDEEKSLSENKEKITPNTKLLTFTGDNNTVKIENEVFTKPNVSNLNIESVEISNSSSRCTSPNSTMSTDDFISQRGKTKIFDFPIINQDDDLALAETVDSFVQRQNCSHIDSKEIKVSNAHMPPPSTIQKSKIKQEENKNSKKNVIIDYIVKQSGCRALDVYDESESDISVYSKGSITSKKDLPNNIANNLSTSSSSSSSSSQLESTQEIVQKVKRLRKRRISTNKLSDKNNSEESDNENQIFKNSTGLPYITKGAAVDNIIKRRRSSQSNIENITFGNNASDREFILKLNQIVQNKEADNRFSGSDSDTSNENIESITARKIAEEVINKSRLKRVKNEKEKCENKEEKSKDKDENLTKSMQSDVKTNSVVITENNLKKAYEEIDKIVVDSELSREKTPEMVDLDITNSDMEIDNVNEIDSVGDDDKKQFENNERNADDNSFEVNGVIYYRIKSTVKENIGWCDEMYRFYNMSWGGENFSVKDIKQNLNRKANWNINSIDRYPKFSKFAKTKCFNCCEFGHTVAKCLKPRKKLVCYMCGLEGHREPRCPNTICLKCGSKTSTYTKGCKKCAQQTNQFCFICKQRGHFANFCPDKWRRYHSTISSSSEPNSHVQYNNIKYCCVCANRGHLAEHCKYAKIYLEYPPSLSLIKTQSKSSQNQLKTSNLSKCTVTYNLLYKPNDKINFSFSTSKNFKSNEYYGRFIKAARLENFFKNKIIKKITKEDYCEEKILDSNLAIHSSDNFSKKDNLNQCSEENTKDAQNELSNDHQFKSPNSVSTKSKTVKEENKKLINNKSNESTTQTVPCKVEVFDSDSNYSFSDHFDVPKSDSENTKEVEEKSDDEKTLKDFSKPQRISRPMGLLPDFIPLHGSSIEKTDNLNNDCDKEFSSNISKISTSEKENTKYPSKISFKQDFIAFNESTNSTDDNNDNEFINEYDKTPGISHKLRHCSESDIENAFPEISSCQKKIFLPKNYSDYLLSPTGNKFLIETSNKHKVKVSIDWTSFGNVLVLEGLTTDQHKFHATLMLELKTIGKKNHNESFEKSLRVPRKRSVLITFLQENLERLDKKIGNVSGLYKQLKIYENQLSKNGLKQANKFRSKLNMVLFGQAGLRDGKSNLDNLLKHLIQLKKDNTNQNEIENVTTQVRDDINTSWIYIFSPLDHSNYEELVDNYYILKRENSLPVLKIGEKIKECNTSFEIHVDKNQLNKFQFGVDRALEKFDQCKKRKTTDTDNASGTDETICTKLPKLLMNITNSNNSSSNFLMDNEDLDLNDNQNETDNSNKSYTMVVKKIEDLLNNINNESNYILEKSNSLSAETASPFWSKQASKYLTNILRNHSWSTVIETKFKTALNSATKGLLSHSDYRNVILISKLISFVVPS